LIKEALGPKEGKNECLSRKRQFRQTVKDLLVRMTQWFDLSEKGLNKKFGVVLGAKPFLRAMSKGEATIVEPSVGKREGKMLTQSRKKRDWMLNAPAENVQ